MKLTTKDPLEAELVSCTFCKAGVNFLVSEQIWLSGTQWRKKPRVCSIEILHNVVASCKAKAGRGEFIPSQVSRATSSFSGWTPAQVPGLCRSTIRMSKLSKHLLFLLPESLDWNPDQWFCWTWTSWRCCYCNFFVFLQYKGTRTPEASPLFLLPELNCSAGSGRLWWIIGGN